MLSAHAAVISSPRLRWPARHAICTDELVFSLANEKRMKQQQWTAEEDSALTGLVKNRLRGLWTWTGIASNLPNRTASQCKRRWSVCCDATTARAARRRPRPAAVAPCDRDPPSTTSSGRSRPFVRLLIRGCCMR